MKFVGGALNGTHLLEIHEQALRETDSVKIAVAYASGSPRILQDSWQSKIKVTFWCRYDDTGPVTLPILRGFLDHRSPNYVCKLVPDIFHSKVIWWEGYGAYVGSANLTDNAWSGNIEAGIFFTDSELAENGMEAELTDFFHELDSHSYALTDEVFAELAALANTNSDIHKKATEARQKFARNRLIPKKSPLTYLVQMKARERQKNVFLKEWQDTLQILRSIADRISEPSHRPSWVQPDVPKGVQADQFLHAFYYSQVREGTRSLHWTFHDKNSKNPERTLLGAMEWWRNLSSPPHDEDRTIYDWAPYLRQQLAKNVLPQLSADDYVELCSKIHALRDHSLRVKHTTFGSATPLPKMNSEERIQLLARWLYRQRSSKGHSVLDTIHYVLWGGPIVEVPNRIFDAASTEDWRIPHFGISTIGELAGWALPDQFPPRNGRTSKALTALGYDVAIHSE